MNLRSSAAASPLDPGSLRRVTRDERGRHDAGANGSGFDGSGFDVTALLSVVALLAATVAAAATVTTGVDQPGIAFGFVLFIALGEFVRVNLPNDREGAPIGAAGALAYAMLIDFGGRSAVHDAHQVVAVTAVGMLIGVGPHVVAGRAPQLDVLARRVVTVAFVAATFRHTTFDAWVSGLERWQLALVMVAFAALAVLLDAALETSVRVARTLAPYRQTLADSLRASVGIGSSVAATGVLIALTMKLMGFWALPIFFVLLMLTQFAFKRYASIRATYRQTIRSLSRVTEVGGYTTNGHARRVCDMSLAVGQELGLSEARLLDLEYAALMHDLGQLSLVEPIAGGATTLVPPDKQRMLAEKGAEVIRETGVLDRVAEIVERQTEPYRRPGEATDPTLPLESRIIRAANAFDDMVGGSLESGPRLTALEQLRLAMAYDYDPRVVEALSRLIERTTPVGA